MKQIILGCYFLLFPFVLFSQQSEFYAGLNSGVLSFRGNSIVNSSFIIRSNSTPFGNYTNDLYSRKSGVGIGLDIGIQRITKNKFIYGIATGLELLKHRIPVNFVSEMTGNVTAKGDINIHSHFINIKPIAGYRFSLKNKLSIDLAASLEIAVGLAHLYEVGSATITGSGETIWVENDRDEIITDIRPGLHVKFNKKKYSLLLGYWIGQSNYYRNFVGADPEAYSNLFRFGLNYRFNKFK